MVHMHMMMMMHLKMMYWPMCSMMHQERERVKADPGLSSVFINPDTGKIWNEVSQYQSQITKFLKKWVADLATYCERNNYCSCRVFVKEYFTIHWRKF
jgi:hypothetical protein